METYYSSNDPLSVMRKSKTNFYYSSFFLDKQRSDALKTIYAFCRVSDDIVDNQSETIEKRRKDINKWLNELFKSFTGNSDNSLLNNLRLIKNTYNIPDTLFVDLIRGMKMDIDKKRYNNFEELKEYCYCVASTVGLMSVRVFGKVNERVFEYAKNLGIALQLTNIIRDIKKDYEAGRIYIPLDELIRFQYSETDLKNNLHNDNYYNLLEYQYNRAMKYYKEARSYFRSEDCPYLLPAVIIDRIYYALLKKIKKQKFRLSVEPIKLTKLNKILIVIIAYFKCRLFKSI